MIFQLLCKRSPEQTGRTGVPYGEYQFKSRRDGYGVAG